MIDDVLRSHPDYKRNLKYAEACELESHNQDRYRININKEKFLVWVAFTHTINRNVYSTPIVINQPYQYFVKQINETILDAKSPDKNDVLANCYGNIINWNK